MEKENTLWENCVTFHGHACGGLAVGYQASLYALELLGLERRATDEEIVCIAENDACGVDAVQVLLGCTLGKGNLLMRLRGKQAFSFFSRTSGKSVRLILRPTPGKSRDERRTWLLTGDYHDMFDVKPTRENLPELARIFRTYICAICGEPTAENHIHIQNGEQVCGDCCSPYTRSL